MRFPARQRGGRRPADRVAAKIQTALALLAEASDYACDTQSDVWDYAVEIDTLQAAGLTRNDLRWLLLKGYLDHALEAGTTRASGRRFVRRSSRTFGRRSCFVLTESGLRFARQVVDASSVSVTPTGGPAGHDDDGYHFLLRPRWDGKLRELHVAGQLVKRLKSVARNQALVLATFEEEGWPGRIDDPLPRSTDHDAKRRLNDTVRGLNSNHRSHRIRFASDGMGEGIRWDWVDGALPDEGK